MEAATDGPCRPVYRPAMRFHPTLPRRLGAALLLSTVIACGDKASGPDDDDTSTPDDTGDTDTPDDTGDPGDPCDGLGVAAFVGTAPFPTIMGALNTASGGQTVEICPGTWTEAIAPAAGTSITLKGHTGDPADVVLSGGGSQRIVGIEQGSVSLISLTLQEGSATEDPELGNVGGAVLVNGGTLTLVDCVLQDNAANDGGGAVYVVGSEGASIQVIDTTFAGNQSLGSGGGLWLSLDEQSVARLEGTTFSANQAAEGAALAVLGAGGTVEVEGSTFASNEVGLDGVGKVGAAIWMEGSLASMDLEVSNSTFTDNVAVNGVIAMTGEQGATLSIAASSITGSVSPEENAGCAVAITAKQGADTLISLTDTTIADSDHQGLCSIGADAGGGGGQATITDSTIVRNERGVVMDGAVGLTIVNSDFGEDTDDNTLFDVQFSSWGAADLGAGTNLTCVGDECL